MPRGSQLLSSSRSLRSSRFSVLTHKSLPCVAEGSDPAYFLRCGLQETPFQTSSHDACHSFLLDINTSFLFCCPMIHFDQGFEADFQISRMVPGLVKQGNRQVLGWETSFVLSFVQTLHQLQSRGRSTPQCIRLFILQKSPQDVLEIP